MKSKIHNQRQNWTNIDEEAKIKGLDLRTLSLFLKELLKDRSLIALGFFLMITATAATLVEPRLIAYGIDQSLSGKPKTEIQTTFQFLALLFLGTTLLRVIAFGFYQYCFHVLGQNLMQRLRQRCFDHLQRLPIEVFENVPVGKLVTRLTSDIASISDMFSGGLVTVFGNFFSIIGIVIGLFFLDLRLASLCLGCFPLLIFLSIHFSGRLKLSYSASRTRLSELNAYLAETILGMKVIQLFSKEKKADRQFKLLNETYFHSQFKTTRIFALFHPTITLFTGFCMAIAITQGGGMVVDRTLSLGVLTAVFSYVLSLFQPVLEIADKWNIFLSGMTSAERIFALMEWKTEPIPSLIEEKNKKASDSVTTPQAPVTPRTSSPRIEFVNVWFAYTEENWVLKDFSYSFEPGKKIAVVGPTGSGKTTVTQLLLGFYFPKKGKILIDGVETTQIPLRELRSLFGWVSQDPFLFSGSIADNLSFESLSQERLKNFLASLDSNSRLSKLLSDERTVLEKGANLSQGEKQLLSFVRVKLSNPVFWILDEATSSLDTDIEKELMTLLAVSSRDKTSLTVAHRLSTIQKSDEILVLKRGELVEKGTHEGLLQKRGIYFKLAKSLEVRSSGRDLAH